MSNAVDSLGYTIFEENQVLTATQLNGVAQYLEDEDRRTRVGLLGVGIACGLRVSIGTGSQVLLSKGIGLTSEGHLLWIPEDVTYAGYKPYPETAPRYEPFYSEETRIPILELVRNATDPGATPLDRLGSVLSTMVAVLLMEVSEKDKDLCSSTDCDNLGKQKLYVPRLLLINPEAAEALMESIATLSVEARKLPDVIAERPVIDTAGAFKALAEVYWKTCTKILASLKDGLAAPEWATLLPPSAPSWPRTLDAIDAQFASKDLGIQYYYDFLKDLVETYTALRDLLRGIDTVCCPDVEAFPSHLLLGALAPAGAGPRTGFYPSPFVGGPAALAHGRFLAAKLGALIEGFKLPEGSSIPVRITPSHGEDRALEDRAIPCYYDAQAVFSQWSWELARQGMSDHCYSYHAASYGAKGGAANPLGTQAGRFSFYRIEGALNAPVATVKAALEEQIRTRNLPFAVRTVVLSNDRATVVVQPPVDYSDLHRFHRLLRQDVSFQLSDASVFSTGLKNKVDSEVGSGWIEDPGAKGVAQKNDTLLANSARDARSVLDKPYLEYRKDQTWMRHLNTALKASGDYKSGLGRIMRTDFQTPLDTLVASPHADWLGWLDQIIKDKEDQRADRLLFNNFLAEHPGLEHFGGVPRGGTFVLVYATTGRVVADFALPYRCCETVETPPAKEVELTPPRFQPDWNMAAGIDLQPSTEQQFTRFETKLAPKFELQDKYFTVFERSANMIGNVYSNVPTTVPDGGGNLKDGLLDLLVKEVGLKVKKALLWLKKLLEPGGDDRTRQNYATQKKAAEQDAARSIEEATRYIADSGMDIGLGSEGYQAMMVISENLMSLSDREVVATLKTRLNDVGRAAKQKPLTEMLSRIAQQKGP